MKSFIVIFQSFKQSCTIYIYRHAYYKNKRAKHSILYNRNACRVNKKKRAKHFWNENQNRHILIMCWLFVWHTIRIVVSVLIEGFLVQYFLPQVGPVHHQKLSSVVGYLWYPTMHCFLKIASILCGICWKWRIKNNFNRII